MRSLPAEFSAPAQRAFGLIIPAAPKLAAIFWNTLEMNKGGGRSRRRLAGAYSERFRRLALAAAPLAGSQAGSQARQIRTEIYFPRALGISVLITSDSRPALRQIPFALMC